MQEQKTLRNTLYLRIFTPYVMIILIILGVFFYFQNKISLSDDLIVDAHSLADISYQQQIFTEKLIYTKDINDSKSILNEFEYNNKYLVKTLETFKIELKKLLDSSQDLAIKSLADDISSFSGFIEKIKVGEDVDSEVLLNTAENIYLTALKISDVIYKEKKKLMKTNLYVNISILLFFGVIAFYLTRAIVNSVLLNLGHVQSFAKNFSIRSATNNIQKNNDEFFEVSQLKNSIIVMKDKVLLETRLAQQESTSKTIGEIAENLAHLINNPLAIIASSARILSKKVKDNDLVQEEAASIQVCVDRITDTSLSMKKLINSETKDIVASFSVLNLKHGVELFFLNRFLENNISLVFDLGKDHKIYARENEILQALFSLVENSIDHIVGRGDIKDKWIKISSVIESSGNIIISIEDCGTNADDNSIYSSMMSQNDKSVGLYSVSQVINKNLGSIEFISKPNTKFSIHLPSKSIFDS